MANPNGNILNDEYLFSSRESLGASPSTLLGSSLPHGNTGLACGLRRSFSLFFKYSHIRQMQSNRTSSKATEKPCLENQKKRRKEKRKALTNRQALASRKHALKSYELPSDLSSLTCQLDAQTIRSPVLYPVLHAPSGRNLGP